MPKISVIVPVYNVEKYLKECLDSVLKQTLQDFEIICVNDGSTDDSLAILQDISKKDNRVIVIDSVNGGASVARNIGLDKATGDYIFFLDSDDVLMPFALEKLYEIALKTKSNLVISSYFLKITENSTNNNFSYKIYHHPVKDMLLFKKSYSNSWNKLYKADVLKNKRFIKNICFEDWVFLFDILSTLDSFVCVDNAMYKYRYTQNSVIHSSSSIHKINSYITGIRFIYNKYKNRPDFKFAKKRYLIALKMCINQVYRDKANRTALAPVLIKQLKQLNHEKIFSWYQLPLKSLYKVFKLKRLMR